jgi:hypothetical protein
MTTGSGSRVPSPTKLTVGGHLTLAAARRLTAALKHQIAMGKDPAADHQAERRSIALSAGDRSQLLLATSSCSTPRGRPGAGSRRHACSA